MATCMSCRILAIGKYKIQKKSDIWKQTFENFCDKNINLTCNQMHKKKNYNIIAFYFCILVDLQNNVKVFVANSSLSPYYIHWNRVAHIYIMI